MIDKVYTDCGCGGKLIGINDNVYYTAPLQVKVQCNQCKESSYVLVDDDEEYLEEQSLMGLMKKNAEDNGEVIQ